MDNIEKIFNIITIVVCIISLFMILSFITMFILLVNYNDCNKINFQSTYCEKYKNF